ncbi:MAG: tRNA (cytidine(34)-2'-O)-methyltransferase [Alphaproteobacteria bacterium]|jgi:tRNA (cytidine/uridine-2'-O-)-methyltransferase|nr:tRNA (cytidine(34)-2'-O)-methyltransferase [Alphaproteobacteria bacterium]MBT5389397.1 tRNA (cytidine(34)-2'-O)-methyltransferase [Alphaproteobacteria bacterium]MBT5654137.1 tRNA (cytidine(34)-2'-O)-methyltransferase [Alphaproteobacteria bacterium]
MRLALFQPEIPQNTGTLLRMGACLGVSVDIIGPCGFVFSERRLRRAGMDYIDHVDFKEHTSWKAFLTSNTSVGKRIILVDVDGTHPYSEFQFSSDDILLLGQESVGVPNDVRTACTESVHIPMQDSVRSLNVAIAASMVTGEALRQTKLFPVTKGVKYVQFN